MSVTVRCKICRACSLTVDVELALELGARDH